MIYAKTILTGLLLFVATTTQDGCTVVYKMPDPVPSATQSQVSKSPQTVTSPPAPVQRPTTAPRVSTISDAVQVCREIQNASNIPIVCEFKYIDGIPTMYLIFSNYTLASNAWQILTENLTAPFCMAANSANRQAQLVLAVHDTKMARVFSCETKVWTEWVNYEDNKGSRDARY